MSAAQQQMAQEEPVFSENELIHCCWHILLVKQQQIIVVGMACPHV